METITLFENALVLVVMLSAPPLVVAIVVGVLVSLVQTVFQVQDQTLPFAIKLVSVGLVLALTAAWIGSELYNLTDRIFLAVLDVGR